MSTDWKLYLVALLVVAGLIYVAITSIYKSGYTAGINSVAAAPVVHDTTIVHDTLTFHVISERVVAKPVPFENRRALDSLIQAKDSLQAVLEALASDFSAHAGDSTYTLDMTAHPIGQTIDYTLWRAPIVTDHALINSNHVIMQPAERKWWEVPISVIAGGLVGYSVARLK